MKKIICIGECALDIIFENGQPVGSMPGGRIVNAAAMLAREKMPVVMASEAAQDPVGDMLVDFLAKAGVDIKSVDRFTDGRTPVLIYSPAPDGKFTVTRYEGYTDDGGFDIIWPRVDEGDIVVYGGYYAIDRRMRPRLTPFLSHCAERKAVMVYLPGFLAQQEPRITRVMPFILENLEIANLVIARNNDLSLIFGISSDSQCYTDRIDFYCRSLVNIDTACHRINYYSGKEVTHADVPANLCATMTWNAGIVAGTVAALFQTDNAADCLAAPDEDFRCRVLTQAVKFAGAAALGLTQKWQLINQSTN